jgi:two-component system, chemotaxis family, CheB/CheR fusion protein
MAGDGEDVHDTADLQESERPAFRRLLEMLNSEHRFDCREYKTVSLLRRIRARMAQVRVEGFDTYADYVRIHAHEATALLSTILVNVTGFFRDPEAWEALRTDALPSLIAAARIGGRLRVWSAGCSTGEETYSAAILIAEALGSYVPEVDVKIYATDIDEDALVVARQAAFRTDQLKDVPGDVLERHFTADGHLFRVRRELRRWCIFGRHNLTQDPPLPQISLLLCRNVLIYFKSGLQERLLTRFHYGLREGGVLFLGRSESLMAHSRGFVPINQKWRLFRRSSDLLSLPDVASLRHDVASMAAAGDASPITVRGVITALPYPVILIGLDDSVREWNEAASALYDIPADHAIGRQFRDLDISYRADGLRARIEEVKSAGRAVRLENVGVSRRSGETIQVDFWVSRVFDERSRAGGILVAAWDGTAVARFREEIVRLGEQYATATEELQSTNEELETTNEELQSTNEELETTNEELQSTNEELVTTIDELQAANGELAARSADVRRLMLYHASVVNSVAEAIVVLDQALIVTSWNPAAERVFGVPATRAVGRYFPSLAPGSNAASVGAQLTRLRDASRATEVDIEFELPEQPGGAKSSVLRFVPLVDGDGTLQGLLGLSRTR